MSQTPPETAWMIQDLDMMYPPQDRAPAYQIKDEEVHDACAYANPAVGQLQPSGSTPLGGAPYQNQYGGDGTDVDSCFGGEWPADLENIHLDCDLPSEADSPLNLENYNMTKVVFVDPDTQSPNPEAALCAPTYQGNPSTPPKYSNAAPNYHHQDAIYYDQPPLVTMETLQPEVTPVAAITDGRCDRHAPTRRGRPRTEWRINKRGPGRPRNKPGRKPTLGVVKTEIGDNEENMYPDITEEKRERRREQNRRAARKLREKKKVHVEHMKQNYEHILSENRRLSSEIDSLKQIINQLESAKKNHVCVCRNYTPSPPSSVTSQPANAYVINGNESRGSFGEVANSMTSSSLTSPSNPLDDFA